MTSSVLFSLKAVVVVTVGPVVAVWVVESFETASSADGKSSFRVSGSFDTEVEDAGEATSVSCCEYPRIIDSSGGVSPTDPVDSSVSSEGGTTIFVFFLFSFFDESFVDADVVAMPGVAFVPTAATLVDKVAAEMIAAVVTLGFETTSFPISVEAASAATSEAGFSLEEAVDDDDVLVLGFFAVIHDVEDEDQVAVVDVVALVAAESCLAPDLADLDDEHLLSSFSRPLVADLSS